MQEIKVSVVIPVYGRGEKAKACVKSVMESNYENIEIIIIDSPRDGIRAFDEMCETRKLKIKRLSKRTYTSEARNLGANEASGKYIFFLDSDNQLDPEAISAMVKHMEENESTGVVGPVAYYLLDKDEVWGAGVYKTKLLRIHRSYPKEYLHKEAYDADIIQNAFMVRTDLFKRGIIFDSRNFTFHEDETDFQWCIREANFKTMVLASAVTYHDIGRTLDHLSPESLYFSQKGRFWIEKKHKNMKGVFGFFWFSSIVLLPYYLIMVQIMKRFSIGEALHLLCYFIRGTSSGLIKSPQIIVQE